jgi:hypothetical protein
MQPVEHNFRPLLSALCLRGSKGLSQVETGVNFLNGLNHHGVDEG